MKKILSMLFVSASIFTFASCGVPEGQKPQLIIGLECNYAPFNWTENTPSQYNYQITGTNTYADGYDVQIAKGLADYLDYELVIKKMEWDGLVPAVQNGMIDLIIAGMSATEDRKIDIDFSSPYYASEHVLLVAKDSEYANITSVSELNGARLGGQIGTVYDDICEGVEGAITEGNHKDTVPQLITLILSDMIDGTILELPVAQGCVEANPNELAMVRFSENNGFTKMFDQTKNEMRDIVDSDREVCIGIAKNRDELLNNINNYLSTLSTESRNNLMGDAVERQSDL